MAYKEYPGWEPINCGCCGGLQWGCESPTECSICKGYASYFRHKKSGALALYPGGPFLGREPGEYIKNQLEADRPEGEVKCKSQAQ